ncbi:acyl-CoA dehydrogenase family protein [Sphingobacterium paludis]|uniref:Alkylation response protein AidB-like acyl-CoA dehydrogenase n=1 Tax=Sphingobacterium paludis TaxID=1476465 RepID=A0A4R7DBH4_9SPHI|nr:acyl-CoA dehydrogenase family protein [Sphingobacterium paludis]TDS17631.1 alkylation response protein AidB-like acyl-CoA dehydrogenase [Sphingobacterium paludis]
MKENYQVFLDRFEKRLHSLFHSESNINELSVNRGLPSEIWDGIMEHKPLSVAIPEAYGGRGSQVKECLGILSAASYESLPLSLTFGINIALFLEPLSKYGADSIKPYIFSRFLESQAMGGLMITEPDFGSDALNMRTYYTQEQDSYRLSGQKHWQGLTGMAEFWLVAARKQVAGGELARDIDFFVTDNNKDGQRIHVEHYFNNLGLYMIPYGLNTIDITVPADQKLQQHSTGIKMMLDILHRSRLQFPGMGMGFIKRMLDEALEHCINRKVGAQKLLELDSVQYQLSRIQSSYSLCSGMCARSASISGIEHDLATKGLEANSMKALVTDLMQEAAQICVQLSGSSGYKIDHVAGRGIVDSRPFQIFEGSNEMLYTQIAEIIVKQMKKEKQTNLGQFIQSLEQTKLIGDRFTKLLDFTLPDGLVQRQLIVLGKVIARLITLQYVYDMTGKGFRSDLFENSFKHMQTDIRKLLSDFSNVNSASPIVEYQDASNWMDFI